ncbi:DUF6744 family protein [Bacillus sp. 37MA]|uniref:DUF6744 family protein n=1 Tax=Bacillus sp. 37MA TaxID=1132442 RepID=UPI00036D5491|nr:DUF6744 family protein [Bacillus sp. 37MA]
MTNEKKVFENVSAVQQPTEDLAIIGYLTWYSVGEDLYDREALRKGLLSYGISEDYLPNPIRSALSFTRSSWNG